MTDIADHILSICNQTPTETELNTPRRYSRRETWIPVAGEPVTAWRMVSHDPDRQLEFAGIYISGDDDTRYVQLADTEQDEPFRKKDIYGGTLWFLDHRGSHELEMKK